MPAPIIIEVTPQARAVIAKLRRFPQDMGNAIKRGMDQAGNTAWHEIDRQRFSGKGPFPPILHKLGQKSERTKQGLMWKAAQVNTTGTRVTVTGTMGVYGVRYFPLHEQGFFRPQSTGKRKINIPKRAPLRTGIEDHRILFQQKIQAELEKEWARKA